MIVSLEVAKDNLGITGTASDAKLQRYIAVAEELVWQYIGIADLDAFYAIYGEDHPYLLEAAVLLIVSTLHDHRTPEPFGTQGIDVANPLSPAVKAVLRRYRQPVVSDADDE